MDDGTPPDCAVVFCRRRASYRTTDADGEPVYVCEPHRPFVARMARPRWLDPDTEVVIPADLAHPPDDLPR